MGAFLLALIFRQVGAAEPLALLARAHKGYLAAAAALYFLMYLVKAERWRYLLALEGIPLGLARSLSWYISSSLFGAFTPGRVGEAVRILGPAREGRRYAESAACAAADKGFDLGLLAALLCGTSFASLLSFAESAGLLGCGLAGGAGLLAGWGAARVLARRAVALPGWLLRLAPGAWRESMREQPQRFFAAVGHCVGAGWWVGVGSTGLFWVLHVTCHFLILRALGGSLGLGYFVLCLTLSSIVEFVPITVSGAGTREYLLIHLFARAGLDGGLAVAFGLMSLVFTYLVSGVFLLAVWLLFGREKTHA